MSFPTSSLFLKPTMIERRPPVEQALRDRMMSNTFYKNSTLSDALKPEQERQKKLKETRIRFGQPAPGANKP